MLLPMLYCITFFVLPAIGMIALASRRAARLRREGEDFFEGQASKGVKLLHTSKKDKAVSVFANEKIMDYQLIESQIHESLHFKKIKQRAPCRAGP